MAGDAAGRPQVAATNYPSMPAALASAQDTMAAITQVTLACHCHVQVLTRVCCPARQGCSEGARLLFRLQQLGAVPVSVAQAVA